MQQSLDYWKEYNIKAVCFGTNSYWSNVYLRNEDRVKEQNIAFFCENPTNDEERDFMLNPTDYTDNSEELQGITGFMTTFVTPEELAQKEATLETAKYFRDAADGNRTAYHACKIFGDCFQQRNIRDLSLAWVAFFARLPVLNIFDNDRVVDAL